MQTCDPSYVVSYRELPHGWAWRVLPPAGPAVSGCEANLAAAQRAAAMAQALLSSLDRAHRCRRF